MPNDNIIDFKPSDYSVSPLKHILEIKRKSPSYKCNHLHLQIDEQREMAICGVCKEEMSLMEAMRCLYRKIFWEENIRERQIEYDRKRVAIVQSAAFECLCLAGWTPEKFKKKYECREAQGLRPPAEVIRSSAESHNPNPKR